MLPLGGGLILDKIVVLSLGQLPGGETKLDSVNHLALSAVDKVNAGGLHTTEITTFRYMYCKYLLSLYT